MKTLVWRRPEKRRSQPFRSPSRFSHLFRYGLLFLALLGACLPACKNYKIQRNRSFSQVEILKNNALLVRLNTSNSKIGLLKNAGKLAEAEKERQMTAEKNRKTMEAFRERYDFSKVYFFYTDAADALKHGRFDEVELFDAGMRPVSDRSFLKRGYLVAAFASVYQDQTYVEGTDNARYAVAGTSGLPALVVMDAEYIQLRTPFPYRVMIDPTSPYEGESVALLNSRLHKHYTRYERKKARRGPF